MDSVGILIGADRRQEWLLPWWWANYSRWNGYPVAFVDFGVSSEAIAWVRGKMRYLPLPSLLATRRGEAALSATAPPPGLASLWEAHYLGPLWEARSAWFLKPSALLLSPFDCTLWLDLDCEVLGSLAPLWGSAASLGGVGLVPEPPSSQEALRADGLLLSGEILYNSGVLLFRRGEPLLARWAEASLEREVFSTFSGDQELLSRLIYLEGHAIEELSPLYNGRFVQGISLDAVVVHWVAEAGKRFIARWGGVGPLLRASAL